MDRVSLLWRLRRRARRGVLCMALFCMTMAVLYTLCAENSVPVTDAIFGVRARTRAQPRAHSIVKVHLCTSLTFPCAKVHPNSKMQPNSILFIHLQVLHGAGGSKPMYVDPQKLPGVIPGDPQKPIPVLSSLNYSMEASQKGQHSSSKERERHGLLTWLLGRPLRRALETVLGGRRADTTAQKVEEFFVKKGGKGKVGEIWNEEMSISMLSKRLKKVVQNYQVRS